MTTYQSLFIADGLLQPTHYSPSLLAAEVLLNPIVGKIDVGTVGAFSIRPYSRFRQWLVKKGDDPDETTRGSSYIFGSFFWSATTIGNRWEIVSGLQSFLTPAKNFGGLSAKASGQAVQPSEHNIEQGAENAACFKQDVKPRTSGQSVLIVTDLTHNVVDQPIRHEHYDCTLSIPPVEMSQHAQYFGSIDWARTSLGPIDRWSSQLRSAVNVVMMDMRPSVLFWGEGIVMI